MNYNRSDPQPLTAIIGIVPIKNHLLRHLRAIFWIVTLVLGFLQVWANLHRVGADGVNYLDMGEAYVRGEWNVAINGLWSPLYSWVLGLTMLVIHPSPFWEYAVVHLVNFVIYMCALGCFEFFLSGLIRYQKIKASDVANTGYTMLPEWVWKVLGYTLFIWVSLDMIGLVLINPDMCVAAVVYLIAGLILRIRMGAANWRLFALLGVILGLGYLAKTVMFLLALVFLSVSLFSLGNLQKAIPRVLLSLLIFLAIASPLIVALSIAKGRLTLGDSGILNYAWYVNGIPSRHWQGDPAGSGIPRHPTRRIFDVPAVYEFGSPVGGTNPMWYDPSYWYEGVTPHFDISQQIRAVMQNSRELLSILFGLNGSMIVSLLILFSLTRRGWLIVRDFFAYWFLLVPAIMAFAMYTVVHLEARYVGPFVALTCLSAFASIHLPDSQEYKRLVNCVAIVMLAMVFIPVDSSVAPRYNSSKVLDLVRGQGIVPNVYWQVAERLSQLGVRQGDTVVTASYANFGNVEWAHLARVRIVAEVYFRYDEPDTEKNNYWAANPSTKNQINQAFAQTGAKVIVANNVPSWASTTGWFRIENTSYYVYCLPHGQCGSENSGNSAIR
jgi:hypothetical protein